MFRNHAIGIFGLSVTAMVAAITGDFIAPSLYDIFGVSNWTLAIIMTWIVMIGFAAILSALVIVRTDTQKVLQELVRDYEHLQEKDTEIASLIHEFGKGLIDEMTLDVAMDKILANLLCQSYSWLVRYKIDKVFGEMKYRIGNKMKYKTIADVMRPYVGLQNTIRRRIEMTQ